MTRAPSARVRLNRAWVNYLKACHMTCAMLLVVHVCRNYVMLGTNEALGWLVFALMYACMEVNTQQDQFRAIRITCATLAVVVTAALACS